MSSLKQLKEQFVSDLLGGSIEEIYVVTSVALTSYLAFKLIKGSTLQLPVLYDFIINVLTILTAITIYSGNPVTLHYAIIIPAVTIFIVSHFIRNSNLNKRLPKGQRVPESDNSVDDDRDDGAIEVTNTDVLLPKKSFLTAYRSHMLIITNLCILAVDFNVFPRRFAKVETWGTSMMDLGVGSFVFSMGLVNSRQLIKNYTEYKFNIKSYFKIIKTNAIKALPVLVLGIVRFVSVKKLEYQEHVTEYGIHWNFFITLGMLPILTGVLDPLLNLVPRVALAFVFSLLNEYMLKKTNMLLFILSSENRMDSWVTMNKEGMYSLIGYFTIFLFGQSFGSFVLTSYPTKNNLMLIGKIRVTRRTSTRLTVTTTQGLIIASLFYQIVFNLVESSKFTTSISRRLANFPYILWVVSYNSTLLLGYHLIDKYIPHASNKESFLLDSINNNGLLIFLLGNLLTGLVNMTINTLKVSNTVAVGVLIFYSSAWTAVAIYLNRRKVYIKL